MDSRNQTQTAFVNSEKRIQTAVAESEYQTQTAESQRMTQEVLEATQQSLAQASQTAIAATQKAESMQFTATAIAPILAEMGTEFEGENSIPDGMYIAREDPTRWDLTSKPGWLHIRGRYIRFGDEDWIAKNVFVYPLGYTNISIITRIDADMTRDGQSIGIALSPSTFESNGYTIRLGMSMENNEGRIVYAWGCDSDRCYYSYDKYFDDPIDFSGPVYLRLDIQGLSYTFYFSQNGNDWTYLGEIDDFSAGDNLIIAAGGGDEGYEFDAYFDFLHFLPISDD
jgi:beta-xylosidase